MDAELTRFEAGALDPAGFRHRDHIRLGFEMLRRFPFTEAAHRFGGGLRAMTARIGRPEAYHETITIAFLALIAERMDGHGEFEAFIAANSDLLDKAVLGAWYRAEQLQSPLARRTFVLPAPAARGSRPNPGDRDG